MNILCFILSLLLSSAVLAKAASSLSKGSKQVINNHDIAWQIGGEIHFEDESGSDYIGTKQINQLVKNQLNSLINIKAENRKYF